MIKKVVFALAIGVLATPMMPAEGMCWSHHHGGHYGGYYGGDAWLWGLGGLVLGTTIAAAAYQPPVRPVVYAAPPPVAYAAPAPAVYAYPPSVPPGMCRWERYVLDGYGRTLLDQRGQPVREYTIGPCQYQPY